MLPAITGGGRTFSAVGERRIIQIKEFLLELLDRLPARVSRTAENVVRWGRALLSIVSEFRVDVLNLHCRRAPGGEPLALLFVGSKRRIPFLMDLLGTEDCTLLKSVRLYFWQVGEYIKRREPDADAIVLNLNKLLYRHVKSEGYLRIPETAQSTLPLRGTFEEVKKRFRRSALRKVSQIIARGYVCEVRRDEAALKHFYNEMYVPYTRARFRGLAVIDSYYKVRRLFRTGFLVTVRGNNEYLSAAVCRIRGNSLIFELIGIGNGSVALLKKGVMDALYYHSILVALQKNCSTINFGNSRPLLNDGLVLYKRKWGTVLRQNRKQFREIGMRCNLSRKAGSNFLREYYPLFFDDGGLSALVSSDGERPVDAREMKRILNKYYDPELQRLIVWSPRGFDEEVLQHHASGPHERSVLLTVSPEGWEPREGYIPTNGDLSHTRDLETRAGCAAHPGMRK